MYDPSVPDDSQTQTTHTQTHAHLYKFTNLSHNVEMRLHSTTRSRSDDLVQPLFPISRFILKMKISAASTVVTMSYRDRSLWISTVWWWLQSLSAAGRWSDLLSQWWIPPHSWESKPSESTRLPLQQERGNSKSDRATAAHTYQYIHTGKERSIVKSYSMH